MKPAGRITIGGGTPDVTVLFKSAMNYSVVSILTVPRTVFPVLPGKIHHAHQS